MHILYVFNFPRGIFHFLHQVWRYFTSDVVLPPNWLQKFLVFRDFWNSDLWIMACEHVHLLTVFVQFNQSGRICSSFCGTDHSVV